MIEAAESRHDEGVGVDFELSAEQRDIVAAFEKALGRESSSARVRAAEKAGFDPELWSVLVGMGALGLAEAVGEGGSSGLLDLVLVAERLGSHLASVPLTEAAVATLTIAEASRLGTRPERTSGVAGMVTFSPRPVRGETAYAVKGAAAADGLVVLDGDELVLARGAVVEPVEDLGFTGAATWHLGGDAVEMRVLARGDGAAHAWRHGVARWYAMTAAECVGVAERSLKIAVDYAIVREQFGVPIGSFQAIQHALAEVALEVDGARLLTRAAAWRHDEGVSDWTTSATAAFANAAEVAVRTAEVCLHVHGGYGYTLEYDPQLYLRRAKGLSLHGGDPETLWASVGAAALAGVA
ncbi:acyl-CoA dehydrogenase family protein [Mumia sp. Pv 4-285]|uniref:acyl-CoA dehydrogenase family protein n=1 Tax=Mumia qirimensis TaxID=3234852 RepID=UPI00351D4BDD